MKDQFIDKVGYPLLTTILGGLVVLIVWQCIWPYISRDREKKKKALYLPYLDNLSASLKSLTELINQNYLHAISTETTSALIANSEGKAEHTNLPAKMQCRILKTPKLLESYKLSLRALVNACTKLEPTNLTNTPKSNLTDVCVVDFVLEKRDFTNIKVNFPLGNSGGFTQIYCSSEIARDIWNKANALDELAAYKDSKKVLLKHIEELRRDVSKLQSV